jgi:hypothetical protein
MTSTACVFSGMVMLAVLSTTTVSSRSQTPAEDVAAQIRQQGYRCDQPIGATRDVRRSKPDSAVWILDCRNAVYRVRLDPDQAAQVTRLKR